MEPDPPNHRGGSTLRMSAREIVAMKLSGHNLSCVRGGRPVFSGVGFAVAAGGALVLTGPNGAGKSSLLRVIAGLIHPSAGRIVLEGGDP